MRSSRPSRWLAPLALLAALAAVLAVVAASTRDGADTEGETRTASSQERGEAREGAGRTGGTTTGTRTSTGPKRRTYTVRPGDTLAIIAERTGVSVEELQELNPDVDPNSLTVGEKIKLTE